MKTRLFRTYRGWCLITILLLIIAGLTLLAPDRAAAHAFLDRSDPAANEVVSQPPDEVRIWFTEPVEPDYTRATLFDADGGQVETESSRIGNEPNALILPLPPDLPNGTYTVQWSNISVVDGHPESGYIPFTVGTQADVATPVPPEATGSEGPPTWIKAAGNWLSLAGISGAIGSLVVWLWAIRPGSLHLSHANRDGVRRRIQRLALASLVIALAGSVVSLGVQAATTGSLLSASNVLDLLFDTRFGYLWLARVALLLMLATVLDGDAFWRDAPPGRTLTFGLVLAAAIPVPFSLISHANAETVGRPAALVADWLHIVAASVWVGGLLALAAGLVTASRSVPPEQRRATFAAVIPRFSTLAISSVIILTLTGFYAAWLHVGNLTALQETGYGQTLIVKLGLTLLLLVLGALHLLVVAPRLRSAAQRGVDFGRTVTAEAALGVVVLLTVGLLISLPTARQTIVADTGQTEFHLSEGDLHATLYLSPGAVGTNRYTADISGGEIPPETEVLLRTSRQDQVEGVREIRLTPGDEAGRFEATGSELSVVGEWQLELLVRRPDRADWRATTPVQIASTPPEERVPGPAPRFTGIDGGIGVLLGGAAVVMLVAGLRSDGSTESRFPAVLGLGFAVTCLITLVSTQTTPTPVANADNPVPMTTESVATGRQLYLDNCAVCHGESARGNGPDAAGLDPPPADLTADHVDDHTGGDIHWWLQKGIGGSAMPGFEDSLSEQQMWHLVNYVRSLRHPVEASGP